MLEFPTDQIFIGGIWQGCAGAQTLDLINPSDGRHLAKIARGRAVDIDYAVEAARGALKGEWAALPAIERGRLLSKLGVLVMDHVDDLAL